MKITTNIPIIDNQNMINQPPPTPLVPQRYSLCIENDHKGNFDSLEDLIKNLPSLLNNCEQGTYGELKNYLEINADITQLEIISGKEGYDVTLSSETKSCVTLKLSSNNDLAKTIPQYNLMLLSGNHDNFDVVNLDSIDADYVDKTYQNKKFEPEKIYTKKSNNINKFPTYGENDNEKKYSNELEKYIKGTLLSEVNRDGKPPVWLRPLAALFAFFGIHGLGQTNCMFCATAAARTIKEGQLYKVNHNYKYDMKEILPNKFPNLQGGGHCYNNIDGLSQNIFNSEDMNWVVTTTRPKWMRFFRTVQGHASNIIKIDNKIFLFDTQKNKFYSVSMLPNQNKTNLENLTVALNNFIGAHSSNSFSLKLYNVGFSDSDN